MRARRDETIVVAGQDAAGRPQRLRARVNASRTTVTSFIFSEDERVSNAGTDSPIRQHWKDDDVRTFHDAKIMAKALRRALAARKVDLSHSDTLEIVADQFGFENWNVLAAKLSADEGKSVKSDRPGMVIQPPVPIFRIFSVEKAMEFYRDFLGFSIDWEHRFGENAPLYCQVSRDAMKLHLSEHAGDASPGARTFVNVTRIEDLHAELIGKNYRYMRPGIVDEPWGKQLEVIDPFNNRITFCEPG